MIKKYVNNSSEISMEYANALEEKLVESGKRIGELIKASEPFSEVKDGNGIIRNNSTLYLFVDLENAIKNAKEMIHHGK